VALQWLLPRSPFVDRQHLARLECLLTRGSVQTCFVSPPRPRDSINTTVCQLHPLAHRQALSQTDPCHQQSVSIALWSTSRVYLQLERPVASSNRDYDDVDAMGRVQYACLVCFSSSIHFLSRNFRPFNCANFSKLAFQNIVAILLPGKRTNKESQNPQALTHAKPVPKRFFKPVIDYLQKKSQYSDRFKPPGAYDGVASFYLSDTKIRDGGEVGALMFP